MRRDTDGGTLDPGGTAMVLRRLSKPPSYPFVERHLWRGRAVGLFAALLALRGQRTQQGREAQASS